MSETQKTKGLTSYHAGIAAEGIVERDYANRGFDPAFTRWRGSSGEIDLIARDGDGFVFVEVKKARDFARAVERVGKRQMERICNTAYEFLAQMSLGLMTPVRFDVALVDAHGHVRVIENAFGEP